MASWQNKTRVLTVLKRLPPALKAAQALALEQETPGLVAMMKRACPESEDLEKTPGELRESVHAYDGHRAVKGGVRAELLKTVTADAKDARGDFIGPHVEHGHLAKDRSRVPAEPWFFPSWRAWKPGFRRRMAANGRAAAKAVAGDIARG